jgi:phosphotransferase system HPr (HPr) family protein
MTERTGKAGISLESEQVALFVQTASRFLSAISIRRDNKTANAKSIMGLISLGVVEDENIILSANGEDAEGAVAELAKFLCLR